MFCCKYFSNDTHCTPPFQSSQVIVEVFFGQFCDWYLDVIHLSMLKTEELTLLAFLRKLCGKQDADNMPHKVNVSRATPVVHLTLHNNRAVLPMT